MGNFPAHRQAFRFLHNNCMEAVFTVAEGLGGVLLAVALAMIAFGYKELRAARALIIAAAIIFVCRWAMWSMTTNQPWWVRALVGAMIGAFLFSGTPAFLKWINERSLSMSSSINPIQKSETPQTINVPVPENIPSGITIVNSTFSNVSTAVSVPKDANLHMLNNKIENSKNGVVVRDSK
jgi:hypothetical protein